MSDYRIGDRAVSRGEFEAFVRHWEDAQCKTLPPKVDEISQEDILDCFDQNHNDRIDLGEGRKSVRAGVLDNPAYLVGEKLGMTYPPGVKVVYSSGELMESLKERSSAPDQNQKNIYLVLGHYKASDSIKYQGEIKQLLAGKEGDYEVIWYQGSFPFKPPFSPGDALVLSHLGISSLPGVYLGVGVDSSPDESSALARFHWTEVEPRAPFLAGNLIVAKTKGEQLRAVEAAFAPGASSEQMQAHLSLMVSRKLISGDFAEILVKALPHADAVIKSEILKLLDQFDPQLITRDECKHAALALLKIPAGMEKINFLTLAPGGILGDFITTEGIDIAAWTAFSQGLEFALKFRFQEAKPLIREWLKDPQTKALAVTALLVLEPVDQLSPEVKSALFDLLSQEPETSLSIKVSLAAFHLSAKAISMIEAHLKKGETDAKKRFQLTMTVGEFDPNRYDWVVHKLLGDSDKAVLLMTLEDLYHKDWDEELVHAEMARLLKLKQSKDADIKLMAGRVFDKYWKSEIL